MAGAKIEIPSVITRVPRDPREERLGFPEDKTLRALFMTGPFTALKWTVEIGAAAKPSIPNLARAIRFAHWRGIRVSLRIPCFHDPMADKKAKDGRLSLKSATTGQPVHIDWLDPTNVEAQDYAIEIAKEGIEAGADEINLDYVRFPVHVTERFAKPPDPDSGGRSRIIRDFVRRVHAETKRAGVSLSLDLFGVAATGSRFDIDRLGQDIAVVGPEAEVIMPVVYPSHYDKGYNGWEHPGDHPEIEEVSTLQGGASSCVTRARCSSTQRAPSAGRTSSHLRSRVARVATS